MRTKITAHRGWKEKYPENTLIAFEKAIEIGADRIELDVHFSKDNKLVVHHDYYLGDKENNLIFEKDFKYIKTFNAEIPLLDEVFTNFGNRMEYEIELKGFSLEFLHAVLNLVHKYDLLLKIEFTSSSRVLLSQLKKLEAKTKTGTFIQPYPSWMTPRLGDSLLVAELQLGDINVAHCPPAVLSSELITSLREKDKMVHGSDCNTEEDIVKAFEFDVDQFSTDKLELALKIGKEFAAKPACSSNLTFHKKSSTLKKARSINRKV